MPAPSLSISLEPLTPEAFAPFGTVIQNTTTNLTEALAGDQASVPPNATTANQGTALKLSAISPLTHTYASAPSAKQAHATMSMFVCKPRELRMTYPDPPSTTSPVPNTSPSPSTHQAQASQRSPPSLSYAGILSSARLGAYWNGEYVFAVGILERHPYTTQTFTPLGLSPYDTEACYLVIVAPSSSTSTSTHSGSSEVEECKQGTTPSNPPDLQHTRAFLAHGAQAVTYGAGTWHAPMVVLGRKGMQFVVVQFVNGVAEEDCQEIVLRRGLLGEQGLGVLIRTPVNGKGGGALL